MPVLDGQIQTERASRYLVQLCKHAAAMGGGGHTLRSHLHDGLSPGDVDVTAEWSERAGTVTFAPWGRCSLTAGPQTLRLCVVADDDDGLLRIQDVLTRDLERFSRRDPLSITWHRSESSSTTPGADHSGGRHRPATNRKRLTTALLATAVLLVVLTHVGLAGTVVAGSAWTGMATNVVVALVVLKVTVVVLARRRMRRRRTL